MKLAVKEVSCRTVSRRLDFGSTHMLTANFYRGCSHGCVYCYVPSLIHDERDWGGFVDAKVNAPEILEIETRKMAPGPVFLSSATDPYQPLEAKYRLTRRCLEVLHRRGFGVSVLTRSPLVLRDVEILKRFRWARVGMSISSVAQRVLEPGVVPYRRRIECLRALSSNGIRTWVSLAPIIPGVDQLDMESLLQGLKEAGVETVFPGLIRFDTYEASRENFEKASGLLARDAADDKGGTVKTVRSLIARLGMEDSGIMEWDPDRDADGLGNYFQRN